MIKEPLYGEAEKKQAIELANKAGVNIDEIKKGGNEMVQQGLKKMHLDQSAHPFACFFSFFFKAGAGAVYIFFSWIWTDYTYAFIFTTILSAFDFYTIKNITGRLLMGLRWWCYNAADGSEHWVYESRDTEYEAHKVDYICFWGAMVLGILFWGFFGFMNVLGLRPAWAVLNGVCLVFLIVNLVGFVKCSTEHKKKMDQIRGIVGNKQLRDNLNIAAQLAMRNK